MFHPTTKYNTAIRIVIVPEFIAFQLMEFYDQRGGMLRRISPFVALMAISTRNRPTVSTSTCTGIPWATSERPIIPTFGGPRLWHVARWEYGVPPHCNAQRARVANPVIELWRNTSIHAIILNRHPRPEWLREAMQAARADQGAPVRRTSSVKSPQAASLLEEAPWAHRSWC